MIIVVDYGMGNLRSVQKGFERIGHDAKISRDAEEIANADKLVLPGVGAFPECMKNLTRFNLIEPILAFIKSDKPFLGICLGLQLLFEESEEFGIHEGLKLIPGRVVAFNRNMGLKIPHMGWNEVSFCGDVPIFEGIKDRAYFYFVHSYYVIPTIPGDVAAETEYGVKFTCAIQHDNIYAVQFHPEKSQDNGLKILDNFAQLS